MNTNEQETCKCPWAHCAQECITGCDHNDPCRHHHEEPRLRVVRTPPRDRFLTIAASLPVILAFALCVTPVVGRWLG